jgi:hypothetical protein
MLKLTEMLFAKLCMAENKKVSDSPIFGIAVWFSQYTVENVQKSYDNLVSEKKDEDSPADIRNNVIIKNLEYDEREKNDSNVT